MLRLQNVFFLLVLLFSTTTFGQEHEERHVAYYAPSGNGYHINFEYRTAFSIGLGMAHILAEGPTGIVKPSHYGFEGKSYYPSQLGKVEFFFSRELRFDMEFDVQYFTGTQYIQICHKVINNVGKDVSFSHLGGSSVEFTNSLSADQKVKLKKDKNEINSYSIRNIKISNISTRDYELETEIKNESLIEQGNEAFSKGAYEEALKAYKSASYSSNSVDLKSKIRKTEKKIQEVATTKAINKFKELKPQDLSKAVNVLKEHLKKYPDDSKVKSLLTVEEFEYLERKSKKAAEQNAIKAKKDQEVAEAVAEAKTREQTSKQKNNTSSGGKANTNEGGVYSNSGYQADQSIYSRGATSSSDTYGAALLPVASTTGSAGLGSVFSYVTRNAGRWSSIVGGYSAWGAASYLWLKPLGDDDEMEIELGYENIIRGGSPLPEYGELNRYRTDFSMGPIIGSIPIQRGLGRKGYGIGGLGWDFDLMTSVVETDYLSVRTGFDGAYYLGYKMDELLSQYQWKTRVDFGHIYLRPFITYSRGVNYYDFNEWNTSGSDELHIRSSISRYETGLSIMSFCNLSVFGYQSFTKSFSGIYNGNDYGLKIEFQGPLFKMWFSRFVGFEPYSPDEYGAKDDNLLFFEIGLSRPIIFYH